MPLTVPLRYQLIFRMPLTVPLRYQLIFRMQTGRIDSAGNMLFVALSMLQVKLCLQMNAAHIEDDSLDVVYCHVYFDTLYIVHKI